MGYFDDEKNVDDYIHMAEGYDGAELIARLRAHLPDGARVLELGMGPGTDLLMLGEHFQVTGSDTSTVFLDRFRVQRPDADLLQLDAATLDTDRTFDCIYSNKVLHHLTKAQLRASFQRQAQVLNPKGIALHSFWHGDNEEEHHGLRFVYYTIPIIEAMITDAYDLIEAERYTEMDADDSFYIVIRKKG